MKKFPLDDNHNFRSQGSFFDMAIPTLEHYLPLLCTLALKDSTEIVSLFNHNTMGGSLRMTSVKIS